ncbi:hypothetical protein L208DRAFT_1391231 [Tricholoma matsutake]|nr:hypothetical protein L208DRAFT_1391231 [Tricholoma matsutake 945]
MSLAKIPFLLAAIIGFHNTLTPPRVPPTKENESIAVKTEGRFRVTHVIPLTKYSFVVLGFIEIIAIIIFNLTTTEGSKFQSIAFFSDPEDALSVFFLNPTSAARMQLSPLSAIGALITFLGGFLRIYCYRALGAHFTFELSVRSHHKLVTTGPYGIVRHPSYSALFISFAGIMLHHVARGSWVMESEVWNHIVGRLALLTVIAMSVFGLLRIAIRTATEDQVLKSQFGQEWEDWAKKVPYAIIPGVY